MLTKIKKSVLQLSMRWPHVVGMAILSGIITGVLAQISFLADTIFTDITVTYEWWVFFLISQTLVLSLNGCLSKSFIFRIGIAGWRWLD